MHPVARSLTLQTASLLVCLSIFAIRVSSETGAKSNVTEVILECGLPGGRFVRNECLQVSTLGESNTGVQFLSSDCTQFALASGTLRSTSAISSIVAIPNVSARYSIHCSDGFMMDWDEIRWAVPPGVYYASGALTASCFRLALDEIGGDRRLAWARLVMDMGPVARNRGRDGATNILAIYYASPRLVSRVFIPEASREREYLAYDPWASYLFCRRTESTYTEVVRRCYCGPFKDSYIIEMSREAFNGNKLPALHEVAEGSGKVVLEFGLYGMEREVR
jgi:hypothetical protein